jgi:uncharacterized protein
VLKKHQLYLLTKFLFLVYSMKKNVRHLLGACIFMTCQGILSSATWGETAIAVDEQEIVVAQDILKKTQQQKSDINQESVNPKDVQAIEVSNDMADRQIQRNLPSLNEPIIDEANILTAVEKQQIEQTILSLYQTGKGQIGVVIVPTTGQEGIFDYALRLAETWQLGSKKHDNGLLIVVAINDHRIQMLTGYGLEGVLPDAMLSRIIHDKIAPYFKQNLFAQGLQSGLQEIDRILNLDPEIAAQAAQDLKDRQEQAYQAQKARQTTLTTLMIILVAGVMASFVVGRKVSAATAAVAGFVAGIVNGIGLIWSLFIGIGLFFLIITTIAQLILQAILSGAGRGGGSGSGGFGGGYGGGGGRFGGGGASGSW